MRYRVVPLVRSPPLLLACALAFCSGLQAQGELVLDGTWRLAVLGAEFDDPPQCGGPGLLVWSASGTVTFRQNGTFAYSVNLHRVCASGTTFTTTDAGAGIYDVADDGSMTLDHDPSRPGTDVETLAIRPDGSACLRSREDPDPEPEVLIALQGSSGRTNASLNGVYHVARLVHENGGNAHTETDLGTMSFDGAGGFTASGQRHVVQPNGSSNRAPYSSNGTYAVANDGALTVNGLGVGAIDPDAEVFFVVTGSGPRTGLTVGVRRGAAVDMDELTRLWGYVAYHVELGTQPDQPRFMTEFGTLEITPTSATAGLVTGDSYDVVTTPLGTTGQYRAMNATVNTSPDGSLVFGGGSTSPPTDGAVSSDGTFLIAVYVDGGTGSLIFGLHGPAEPEEYGQPTPGTGGVPPRVAQVGLPMLGNPTFGLRVLEGRGGAAAALVITAFPSSQGIPFLGGTLWVDPATMIASISLSLSGSPGSTATGSATLGLALPTTPLLDGARMYLQAITLDPSAPLGLAMSKGLQVELGR